MSGMGKSRKSEGEAKLIGDPDVIRQGFMKRMKNGKVRFFVLWQKSEKGEARIEYYEDKNKLIKPHKVFFLKDVFRVSIKGPSKQEYIFSLHTNDELFSIGCQSDAEMREWVMDIITTRPHGAEEKEVQQLGHIMAWRVIVLHNAMSNIFRFQRNTFIFVLDHFSFSLINPDDHSDCWHWQMKHIRNCGNNGSSFIFESGRSSFSGAGHMYLQMSSNKMAVEAHHIVLEQMRKCLPDAAMEAILAQLEMEQKQRLDAIGRRQRGLSAPMEPVRAVSPPAQKMSRSRSMGAHQSHSIDVNMPLKRPPVVSPPEVMDDAEFYVEMQALPAPRERSTPVQRRYARQKSMPSGGIGRDHLISPRSNSAGSDIRHIHHASHTTDVRSQQIPTVRSSSLRSHSSGLDSQQAVTSPPPRQNVFLRSLPERDECPISHADETPDQFQLFPPQANSQSCSPASPSPASSQPNSIDCISQGTSCPSDSLEKTMNMREIVQHRRRQRHVYEEVPDSGISEGHDLRSRTQSMEEAYENLSLQGSRSYEIMSLDRESPSRELRAPRSQPIVIKASPHNHKARQSYEQMTSPMAQQMGESGSIYEEMKLQGVVSRGHTAYENHRLQWQVCESVDSNDVQYEVPHVGRSTSSSPTAVY